VTPPGQEGVRRVQDPGSAEPRADDAGLTARPTSPREIVSTVLTLLRAHYVFPDRAEQAATAVQEKMAAGDYDELDETTLASRLTDDLYEVCRDKHLRVRAGGGPGPGPARPARAEHRRAAAHRRRSTRGAGRPAA
jgi:hypothetical protein